jgi:hypothetical protein
MQQRELGTFEMLWDCPACGTPKLLGIQHRHCPACGSPQDPAARYYPSEQDKVAVQDHVYQGADVLCPACGTANAAASQFCVGCGSPIGADAKQAVGRVEHQVAAGQVFAGETIKDARAEARARRDARAQHELRKGRPASSGPSPRMKLGLIVGGVLLLCAVLVWVFVFWKREATMEIEGHRWARTIDVEVFDTVRDSAWCDELPRGARRVGKSREQRSTKQVQDGQECVKRRQDNRDGTFKEVEECKPKYRSEPVYDDRCHFDIDKWVVRRTEESAGQGKRPEPSWPAVKLAKTGSCKGCEREGARRQLYMLRLLDRRAGQAHECAVDEATWQKAEPGSQWTVEVKVVGGGLDCETLRPAQ